MLHCPVDDSTLVSDATRAVAFATCARCAGVWFAGETLARHAVEPVSLPATSRCAEAAREVAAPERRPRVCVACARLLTAVHVDGIEIDCCDGCGGVWLDAGEYDAIRTRLADLRRPTGRGWRAATLRAPRRGRIARWGIEAGLEVGTEATIRAVLWAIAALLD